MYQPQQVLDISNSRTSKSSKVCKLKIQFDITALFQIINYSLSVYIAVD